MAQPDTKIRTGDIVTGNESFSQLFVRLQSGDEPHGVLHGHKPAHRCVGDRVPMGLAASPSI